MITDATGQFVFDVDSSLHSFMVNALLCAADEYARCAKVCRADDNASVRMLAVQFDRQVRQAQGLATTLDDCSGLVILGDHITGGQLSEWGKL